MCVFVFVLTTELWKEDEKKKETERNEGSKRVEGSEEINEGKTGTKKHGGGRDGRRKRVGEMEQGGK